MGLTSQIWSSEFLLIKALELLLFTRVLYCVQDM